MNKYKVTFEIHIDRNRKTYKEIIVEAGNKKFAMSRALSEISKVPEFEGLFKNVKSVEEIKNAG